MPPLAVIGTTEIVLIVVGALLMLGVPTIAVLVLWKLVKNEQARKRGLL